MVAYRISGRGGETILGLCHVIHLGHGYVRGKRRARDVMAHVKWRVFFSPFPMAHGDSMFSQLVTFSWSSTMLLVSPSISCPPSFLYRGFSGTGMLLCASFCPLIYFLSRLTREESLKPTDPTKSWDDLILCDLLTPNCLVISMEILPVLERYYDTEFQYAAIN